jgi:hypothetical protein
MEDENGHHETFSGKEHIEKAMMKRISGESWRENFRHVNSESA